MTTESTRRVLVDVDTGIDDALALLYAVAAPGVELVGVSTVVGNVPARVGARNSRAVLALAGAPWVPVVAGAEVTTDGNGPRTGLTNHGTDGLGGVDVPAPPFSPHTCTDPSAMVEQLTTDRPLTIAACAPLTNVARHAHQAGVAQVVVVGGELVVEGRPEFNIGHDPAAAVAVLAADPALTIYAIDVFEDVTVPQSDVERLRNGSEPAARLAGELLAVRRGHLLGDAGALLVLTHPGLFTLERRRMAVVAGRLVLDEHTAGGRVVDVVTSADGPALVDAYLRALTTR